MLDFNVIVKQVMALSLERIIWYDFNGFLHVEFFVEEPIFSLQIAGNEHWEVVHMPPYPKTQRETHNPHNEVVSAQGPSLGAYSRNW